MIWELLEQIPTWLSIPFAVIGLIGAVYKSIAVWASLKVLHWHDVERYSRKLIRKMRKSHLVPDIIVGIGRGGAILGALLSGNLLGKRGRRQQGDKAVANIPLVVLDRRYEWRDGQRIELSDPTVDLLRLADKAILLVAGDVSTGETMEMYKNQLIQAGAKEVHTACLVKGMATTLQPEYYGKALPADFRMPWMYKGYGYVRDSRRPTSSRSENRERRAKT